MNPTKGEFVADREKGAYKLLREKNRERGKRPQLFCPHLEIVGATGPRDQAAESAASAENLNLSEPRKKRHRLDLSAARTA